MDLSKWLRHQWDRTAAVVLLVVGLVVLLAGWLGVSRNSLPAAQIPYVVSGGILGLFILGAAITLWLSADLRDLWRKVDDLHREIARRDEDEPGADAPPAAARSNGRTRLTAPDR